MGCGCRKSNIKGRSTTALSSAQMASRRGIVIQSAERRAAATAEVTPRAVATSDPVSGRSPSGMDQERRSVEKKRRDAIRAALNKS